MHIEYVDLMLCEVDNLTSISKSELSRLENIMSSDTDMNVSIMKIMNTEVFIIDKWDREYVDKILYPT